MAKTPLLSSGLVVVVTCPCILDVVKALQRRKCGRGFWIKFCSAVGTLALIPIVSACSWVYLIWAIRSKPAEPLFRFLRNGKAGYIDSQGRILLPPTLPSDDSSFGEFHEGLVQTLADKQANGRSSFVAAVELNSSRKATAGAAVSRPRDLETQMRAVELDALAQRIVELEKNHTRLPQATEPGGARPVQ